jgi:hypothetical protein
MRLRFGKHKGELLEDVPILYLAATTKCARSSPRESGLRRICTCKENEMPCTSYKTKEGGVVIACTRGRRTGQRCEVCGAHSVDKLCDYPLRGSKAGKTCDKKLCRHCAVSVGSNKDYCPAHHRHAKKMGELPC